MEDFSNLFRQSLFQVHGIDPEVGDAMGHLLQFQLGRIRQVVKVGNNQLVWKGHYLAEHVVGRFFHAHVVVQAFAHLLDTIRAHQDWHQEALLGALPHHPLQFPAH